MRIFNGWSGVEWVGPHVVDRKQENDSRLPSVLCLFLHVLHCVWSHFFIFFFKKKGTTNKPLPPGSCLDMKIV